MPLPQDIRPYERGFIHHHCPWRIKNPHNKVGYFLGGLALGVVPSNSHESGQITIIPQPELRGFWGDSLTKTTIWVTNRRFGRYNLPRSSWTSWTRPPNFKTPNFICKLQRNLGATKSGNNKIWCPSGIAKYSHPKHHWTLLSGFWDLQTSSFEIPWFLGQISLGGSFNTFF